MLENKASQRPNHTAYKKKKLHKQLVAQQNNHHKSPYRGLPKKKPRKTNNQRNLQQTKQQANLQADSKENKA
jgi:hypothetical protein